MTLLIIEGVLIGCLLGLTGAGGGILAVPALIASQGWSVAQAAPVGLLAITFSALIGTIQGLIKRIVRYKAAIWIALSSIPMTHVGVWIANHSSPAWLGIGFSAIMFFVAYRLFKNKAEDLEHPLCQINPATGKLFWNAKTVLVLGSLGSIAGLLTGMLGVGGGFVLVPALRKTTNIEMHSIVATSLMIIFLIGGFSIAIHVLEGFRYPLDVTAAFSIACITGLIIGRLIVSKIPASIVQTIFAFTVICVATYLTMHSYALLGN